METGSPLEHAPVPNYEDEGSDVEVRELAPETYWAGSVPIPNEMPGDELETTLKECAEKTGFTYSGYVASDGDGNTEYHFSRYPRRAFGPVASIETYQQALGSLAEALGTSGTEKPLSNEPKFSVLLGMQEGYAEYKRQGIVKDIESGDISDMEDLQRRIDVEIGDLAEFGLEIQEGATLKAATTVLREANFGKEHTIEETRDALGNGEFDLERVEILAAGGWGTYTEPAVVIEGNMEDVQKVYAVAERFKQARIAVEDLQNGTSHMVETVYCEDPDES